MPFPRPVDDQKEIEVFFGGPGGGLGRVGAFASPIIAGLLAANGWGMYALFLLFAIPLVFGAAMIFRFKV